ncbi:MAG: trehalose-phosphatase [Candidatus Zixiibacteriota bacterium]|nr:MAG: trehalose-phosphatase [candidate division Zixibacteria bacterium]
MEILNRRISLDTFFTALKSAKHRILMLDYDGTLSPFTEDRDNALPYPDVKSILEEIISQGNTRLIIISGRPINVLKNLLGLKHLPEMWGSHGAERYSQKEGYTAIQYAEFTRNFLSSVIKWAKENNLDDSLEIKPFGIAFHWRGASDIKKNEIETIVEAAWNNRLAEHDLEFKKFDGGIEIRHNKINKGSAVSEIMKEYKDDYVAAYLGDDYTDEDAFNTLGNKGLKILIGKVPRLTAADIILSPPEELLDFLGRWSKSTA